MAERRGTRTARAGAIVLGALGTAALVVPWAAGLDPAAVDLAARLEPPSGAHPLGRDALGRDVLARLCIGARVSLAVAGAAVALSAAIGTIVGAWAGWRGGWVDVIFARVIDVFLAFPGLLLAIALAGVLGPSHRNVVLALAALGWTSYARLARAHVAAARRREYVDAARALGSREATIVARHVLPAAGPILLVQAAFGLSGAVLAEASLSFLGLGAPPPAPSWGAMLDEGRLFMFVAPHAVIAPAAALAGTVLALQLLGDGLRDLLALDGQR